MKWRLLHACFCLLLYSAESHAHLLNMTEVHVDASQSNEAVVNIKIDLGQSLLSPDDYWQAVSAGSERQGQLIAPAVQQLVQGLKIYQDGEPIAFRLTTWNLEAVSLAAISNPLSPQMATLSFSLDAELNAVNGEIEVSIEDGLEVPWPILLRLDSAENPLPISRLLTTRERSSRPMSLSPDAAASNTSSLASLATMFQAWVPGLSWLAVGFQHIIPSGLDHIVFVLGLFFLSTRLSTLMYQVSCFTVAHSLSLGLATLGVVSVPAGIVEPLIAASIIFIAVDNLYSDYLARWRLVVVTLFGLLHGLGFASALSNLILPAENFYTTLLFFNLGVEAGQLTVLAIAFVAVGWLRNWSQYSERVARPATVTIAGVGTYWLVKRVALGWL